MQAFTKHLLPRLGIEREKSDPQRLRVTLLSRTTRQRRFVNEKEVRGQREWQTDRDSVWMCVYVCVCVCVCGCVGVCVGGWVRVGCGCVCVDVCLCVCVGVCVGVCVCGCVGVGVDTCCSVFQLLNAMKTVGYFDVQVVDYKYRYTHTHTMHTPALLLCPHLLFQPVV